jgi:predicted small secreted protein
MRDFTKRRAVIGLAVVVTVMMLAACNDSSGASTGDTLEHAQQKSATTQLVQNQPLPQIVRSQMRQNLIEIELAQATGVATTTFEFNQGVIDPIDSCPSIGVPIANTTSLSNPLQTEIHDGQYNGGNTTIGQMDPNGVYSPASSSGTYIMCIGADGVPYVDYWEGFVKAVFAPAKWDYVHHKIEIVGPASFKFSKKLTGPITAPPAPAPAASPNK